MKIIIVLDNLKGGDRKYFTKDNFNGRVPTVEELASSLTATSRLRRKTTFLNSEKIEALKQQDADICKEQVKNEFQGFQISYLQRQKNGKHIAILRWLKKTSSQNKITLCQNFFGVLQLNLQSFDKNNLEHFVDRLNRRNPKIKD